MKQLNKVKNSMLEVNSAVAYFMDHLTEYLKTFDVKPSHLGVLCCLNKVPTLGVFDGIALRESEIKIVSILDGKKVIHTMTDGCQMLRTSTSVRGLDKDGNKWVLSQFSPETFKHVNTPCPF